MKFTKLFAAVLCIATIATACQEPFEEPAAQGKVIKLSVDVDNYTKATDTAFEDGDQIGLHIVIPQGTYRNNDLFTYTAGALTSEETVYWYLDETLESDVYAYYPYSATSTYNKTGNITFTVNADQSREGAYTASDLMIAATTSKPTAEAVELPFHHAFSKIIIKIDNQLEEEIEDVYFSNVFGSATVNFKEGTSTPSGKQGTIKTAKVTINEQPAYTLIVAPQEEVSPQLIIKTATKQYTYQLSGNISFSAGKVSTAEITVSDESISTAFTPTISDWVGDNDLQFGQGEGYEGGDNAGGNIGGGNNGGATSGTIYLHPGVWDVGNAWFVAYFFNDGGNANAVMTDNDGDGVYECGVPEGMTSVIFCRINPAYTDFGWNDDTMTDENKRVWNQTDDLTIGVAPNNHFHITDWAAGSWQGADYDGSGAPSGLGVIGGFAASGWGAEVALLTTKTAGITVAKGIAFNAGEGFKIRTIGTWDELNIGAGDITVAEANKYFAVTGDNAGDISVAAAGTYDIYFNQTAMRVYLMTAGTPYTEATEQTTNGQELEPEQPEATETVIYFSVGLAISGERYAAYFWDANSVNVWASMTDNDSDGIYEVNIPVGYSVGDNVIFCAMKGTANGWNNKVNQTGDLVIPTDGKNFYTLGSSWSTGSWSVK